MAVEHSRTTSVTNTSYNIPQTRPRSSTYPLVSVDYKALTLDIDEDKEGEKDVTSPQIVGTRTGRRVSMVDMRVKQDPFGLFSPVNEDLTASRVEDCIPFFVWRITPPTTTVTSPQKNFPLTPASHYRKKFVSWRFTRSKGCFRWTFTFNGERHHVEYIKKCRQREVFANSKSVHKSANNLSNIEFTIRATEPFQCEIRLKIWAVAELYIQGVGFDEARTRWSSNQILPIGEYTGLGSFGHHFNGWVRQDQGGGLQREVAWTFTVRGQWKRVELIHNVLSGKRVIYLDGIEVATAGGLIFWRARHSFSVFEGSKSDTDVVSVKIQRKFSHFEYDLTLDGISSFEFAKRVHFNGQQM